MKTARYYLQQEKVIVEMKYDKLTLHKPETYQITIPGELEAKLVDIAT